MEKNKRVLKGGAVDGLNKAKKDILGAFAVAEGIMSVVDKLASLRGGADEESEEAPEGNTRPAPQPPPQKVEATVIGRRPDGVMQVVLGPPGAVVRRRP